MHYIIGTAGHIDHGKTSLTKRLTNVDTDRLQEEKERNISIELGFAPLKLPSGKQVSIIDVPGHERFIRHMVAGVGGIDFVLFVVAADEGVMPQTTEHLHILHLLGIEHGIIVLTKIDLVEQDFLELVYEDVREAVKHTFLADAPICPTSTVTGEGIDALTREIEALLPTLPQRSSDRPFQLPIDRVFTLKGVGTVVTGTVYSGKVRVGEEVELLPDKQLVKTRQIQVHGREVTTAHAGQRAALNLSQVKKEQLSRGQLLAEPGQWKPTTRVDAHIKWLPDAPTIKHQARVNIYVGSTESEAEMILYDRPALSATEGAYITLRLYDPIVVSRGDRFIVRRPSPPTTLGGGEIIEPYAQKRKYHPPSAQQIERLHKSDVSERLRLQLARGPLVQSVDELAQTLTESMKHVSQALAQLQNSREIVEVLPQHFGLKQRLDQKQSEGRRWLQKYHERHPLRQGPSRAEWVSRFLPGLHNKIVESLLQLWRESFETSGDTIAAKPFQPFIPEHLTTESKQLVDTVKEQGLRSETWDELTAHLGIDPQTKTDLLTFLEHSGLVIILTDGRAVSTEAFTEAKNRAVHFLQEHETMTMQDARALFGLSRKYLVPLLERMDADGVTRREDNVRRLVKER